jgi:hypothetical protein
MSNITLSDHQIIKEAAMLENFVSGALGQIKELDLKEKPFESIFNVITPIIALRFGFLLGSVIMAADYAFGFGPSAIGKMIDDYLKKGGEITREDLSESNLKSASEYSLENIWSSLKSKIGMESKSSLQDIMTIKGSITPNDVIAISHMALQKDAQPWFGKKPWFGSQYSKFGGTRVGFLRRFVTNMRRGQRFPLFSGALFGLLRVVSTGLLGLAIFGGVAKMVGLKSKEEREVDTETPGAFQYRGDSLLPEKLRSQTMQLYANETGNVEDTLIKFLNATVANFSRAFQTLNKRPIKGSPQMKSVLEDVELLNWGNLDDVNNRTQFVAPRAINLAKKLLPEAKYERIEKPPVKKPVPAAPVLKESPQAKELAGLLQGVR